MRLRLLLIALFLGMLPTAFAGTVSLNDWCFYVNTIDVNRSCSEGAGGGNFNPPVITSTMFDYQIDGSGLGTVTITLTAGIYKVFAVYNYDINNPNNPTESATNYGFPSNGFSISGSGSGILNSQALNGGLNGQNQCGSGCSDPAVAIGSDVTVPDGGTGTVTFTVGNTPPSSGPYVGQTDGSGNGDLFFSETSTINNPEPGTVVLMTSGIALMLIGIRRKKQKA